LLEINYLTYIYIVFEKDKNDLFGISLVVSQNISNLKELEISNHVFTIDRISIIMQGLMDNHNLEKLSFPNNMIDD